MFWLYFLFFLGLLNRFGHWLINLPSTSQSDDSLYFIHPWGRAAGRTYLMDSPRIWLSLGREFSFLLYLEKIGNPSDEVLKIIYFMIEITLEPINLFVQGALHSINSLSQLHIDSLLLFHKITYHLAQI